MIYLLADHSSVFDNYSILDLQYSFSCNILTRSASGKVCLFTCFSPILILFKSILDFSLLLKSMFKVMPLRSCRFIILGYHHYYEHIRLPSLSKVTLRMLGYPTFMRYLRLTRNIILLRISLVGFTLSVSSNKIAGLITFGRLTDIISVTKPDWCSLSFRTWWALTSLSPPLLSQWLQPERQIGSCSSFIYIGIYLYLRTPRGAPKNAEFSKARKDSQRTLFISLRSLPAYQLLSRQARKFIAD